MLTPQNEFRNIITKRLNENSKSFNILLDMQHYGNCISILCQELDQYIRLLFLFKQPQHIRDELIGHSINNQKWYYTNNENKKVIITDQHIEDFAKGLQEWDSDIFEFRNIFYKITINFNYILRDPIKGLNEMERELLYKYIREYHDSDFPKQYSINDLFPILPAIFTRIYESIKQKL